MDQLPDPTSGKFTLAVLPRRPIQPLLSLAARLALSGPLRVLDGGNCFNAYIVAQALRLHMPDVDPVLERITVARAFTCYQMLTLLQETPVQSVPTLVLDMLATFRDENVPEVERRRLLMICLERLQSLALVAPLLVSASTDGGPPMSRQSRSKIPRQDGLLAMLEAAAGQVWRFGPLPPPPVLRLF